MDGHALTETLLHSGDKRLVLGNGDISEGQVGRNGASAQRTGIV